MGVDTARNNYAQQRNQARSAHWELTSEFDSMLSQLLAQDSMVAKDFVRRYRNEPATVGSPDETPLARVEALWKRVFTGRELLWRDWKPMVVSSVAGDTIEYSGNQMSDGERAALFLAGRVFSAEPGILVVDEPETHFHSLLAVKLWNELEEARPDIRFIYITHDLTFALSRKSAQYVLASPTDGLRPIDLGDDLPSDVAGALLGSASLSFYARRVVFCEGGETSLDAQLYNAWFNGAETVVRPVDNCGMVLRCVDATNKSGIAQSLHAIGIIDRDFHSEKFLSELPPEVHALPVHEVEALYCLPAVVEAVCAHLGRTYDENAYHQAIHGSVDGRARHRIVVERWKARIRPELGGIISTVNRTTTSLEDLVAEMPTLFSPTSWSFSPQDMLGEEKVRVEAVVPGGPVDDFLSIAPSKKLVALAARAAGMEAQAYTKLVTTALAGADEPVRTLGEQIANALEPLLPTRIA